MIMKSMEADVLDLDIDEPIEPVDSKTIFPNEVIIDTREQSPFHFSNIDPWRIVPVSHRALSTGDYSLTGYESQITIERKSVSDFLGSITAERERFEREFQRMSQMTFAAVVIEDELRNVLSYAASKTRIKTDSILGTLDSWRIRYGVHWIFCMGRRHAEINTLTMLYQFIRNSQRAENQIQNQIQK